MIHNLMVNARTGAAKFINAMSPVKVYRTQKLLKAGRHAIYQPMPRYSSKMWQAAKQETAGMSFGEKAAAYLQGHHFGSSLPNTMPKNYAKATHRNMLVRRTTLGLAGAGLVGGLMLGPGSAVTEVGNIGMSAIGTGLASAGALELGARVGSPYGGALLGAGIAAYSMRNIFAPGNQTGPF